MSAVRVGYWRKTPSAIDGKFAAPRFGLEIKWKKAIMSIWSAVPAVSPEFSPKSRLGVDLKVRDLEVMVPFYRHFLDMEPVFQDVSCARFEG